MRSRKKIVGTAGDRFTLDGLLSDCRGVVSALSPPCQGFSRYLRTLQYPSLTHDSKLAAVGLQAFQQNTQFTLESLLSAVTSSRFSVKSFKQRCSVTVINYGLLKCTPFRVYVIRLGGDYTGFSKANVF